MARGNELKTFLKGELRSSLTPKEMQVAIDACRGLRGIDSAKRLGMSYETQRCHMTRIYNKTGMSNKVELTLYALKNGIVSLEDL